METKTLPACPVETTLMLISDKWKVLILRDLLPGTKRFGELKRSVGNVSQKVLTAQLRQMEAWMLCPVGERPIRRKAPDFSVPSVRPPGYLPHVESLGFRNAANDWWMDWKSANEIGAVVSTKETQAWNKRFWYLWA